MASERILKLVDFEIDMERNSNSATHRPEATARVSVNT